MKICWDNLERIWLSRNGNLKISTSTYIEMGSCKLCGDPYLTIKSNPSSFCSHSCAKIGENNPNYGKPRLAKTRKKLSIANTGKVLTAETIKKISESASKRVGPLNPNYRGGVTKNGLTVYDTYKEVLWPYENIRKQVDSVILEAKCAYCGKWYQPTYHSVSNRIKAINNLSQGECRLYCSENCKQVCPTYNQKMYPKGFKHTTSREVSPYLRQMVFERDNWTCQICGKTIKEAQLHVHHTDPIRQNPMFQNDIDSCITLCKECHKRAHSRKGCRYVDLQCKKKETINVENRNKPMLHLKE